jgi:peptide/nickel transport system ATP-binding protein
MTALSINHLSKHFTIRDGRHRSTLKAVDDVSFELRSGETVALVGESGSGKSTIARMLARLTKPTAGEMRLDGVRLKNGFRAVRRYRGDVQMVFQDPFGSLNPSHSIAYHLRRPLRLHGLAKDSASEQRGVYDLLDRVNLRPVEVVARRYPHELSGGQRQRVAIARALAPRPRVLLADEPVSMLDVSIRLEILNLIDRLKQEEELAVLYVTHDLATARYFASSIMVMYRGQIVETGPSDDVILSPSHPYTRLLANAAPDPNTPRPSGGDLRALRGGQHTQTDRSGCLFRARCPHAFDRCTQEVPMFDVGPAHDARCFLHDPGVRSERADSTA